jgi:hypothetical protein
MVVRLSALCTLPPENAPLSAIHHAIVGLLLSAVFWRLILLSKTLFYKQKKIDGASIKIRIHLSKCRPASRINAIISDSCGPLWLDLASHWNRKKHLGVICVHIGWASCSSASQQLLSLPRNSPFVMQPKHLTYSSNNSVYTILPYTFNTIFNIRFPSSPWYSKWSLHISVLTFCVYLFFFNFILQNFSERITHFVRRM